MTKIVFIEVSLSQYSMALAVLAAVLLDALLGEPKRWHPLVGFGWLANRIESYLNPNFPLANSANFPLSKRGSEGGVTVLEASPANSPYPPFTKGGMPQCARIIGLFAWPLLLTPFVLLSYFATHSTLGWLIDVLLLYFAIGARSLMQHAQQIYTPLSQHNLVEARYAISMIVSRDTAQLNETDIATATVESVLENGNDAIFGAIFWFVLLGGSGALMFRLANTLDAMWGYRTPRFNYFGWAAARLDDALNLIPARLTALSYALCGKTTSAIQCWANQAHTWYSPNAGPVMAAGAGALQVKLGGNAIYHGKEKQRPSLGLGETATNIHILTAMRLVKNSLYLWCGVILFGQILWRIYLA